MRFTYLTLWAAQAASVALANPIPDDAAAFAQLAEATFEKSMAALNGELKSTKRAPGPVCNASNVKIRKEWNALTVEERKAYISAVKCLQSKPANTPSELAPGAKTRFDDFVANHINQTLTIHYTANFLTWHRYFTFQYESALRNECGYQGTQPYWDWTKTAVTGLASSPIFDGSDSSMSGDGESIGPQPDIILGATSGLPPVFLPTGNGGGCVTSGPFKDMVVNLGPAALDAPGGVVVANPEGPLTHNPRCLKRDLSDKVNQDFANATAVMNLLNNSQDIENFQLNMQGVPGSGNIGVHGGGHYSLGGDPGRDVFTSPGDPAFYLHHANIDRIYSIWQSQCPRDRLRGPKAIAGTRTFLNNPPSDNGTLEDLIDLGFAASPPIKIGDALSTMSGPFCYIYQ